MAVVFMDGFDHYTTADLPKRWTAGFVQPTIASLYARFPSGQGCNISYANTAVMHKTLPGTYTGTGVVGFAFYATTNVTSRTSTMAIWDGASTQIDIRTDASSRLIVTRNATLLATGTTGLQLATWYYVELKFSIHPSAGTVLLSLNGTPEVLTYVTGTSTTQNTRTTANSQWSAIALASVNSTTNVMWVDDIYVIDASTGTNTDFLGPVRVVALNTATPGTYADFTANGSSSNYGAVSEMFQDGDTSFNASSTLNHKDTFTLQDPPMSSGSVYAVQTILTTRQDSGAGRSLSPVIRMSGADYVGTTGALGTSYVMKTDIYDANPTGTAWDASTLAGIEVGYKLVV